MQSTATPDASSSFPRRWLNDEKTHGTPPYNEGTSKKDAGQFGKKERTGKREREKRKLTSANVLRRA